MVGCDSLLLALLPIPNFIGSYLSLSILLWLEDRPTRHRIHVATLAEACLFPVGLYPSEWASGCRILFMFCLCLYWRSRAVCWIGSHPCLCLYGRSRALFVGSLFSQSMSVALSCL
eukprot:Lithocolla_globosa_v1_NODE_778_length_3290_cov_24.418547.p6 type:complete len:116 gc:universal NODE_778_length_3290_cov_24.418547:549-896(+)